MPNADERESCAKGCKTECQLTSFGLTHQTPELFYVSQWRCHPVIYPVYRVVVALYFFGWIIYTGTGNRRYTNSEANRVKWFIYLTNWCTFVLTTCLIVQAIISVHGYVMYKRLEKGERYKTVMPWYLKLEWVWYNVAINSAFLLTISFWALLYAANTVPIEEISFHTHAINSIYVLIDLFVTAVPLRMLHFFHGIIYAAVYVIFSVIYVMAGGTGNRDQPYIYSVLDWKSDPSTAALYSVIIVFVAVPVVWLFQYGLYRLRLVFSANCCCVSVDDEEFDASEMPTF